MRKDFKIGGPARQFKQVLERLGGDEKAKPHSTKKGRIKAAPLPPQLKETLKKVQKIQKASPHKK